MVLCIAPLNMFAPYFQTSILYTIPLMLLACYGQLRALRWMTLVTVALTFITYFLGCWLQPPATGTQYLNFRIVNRAMVAGMLWLMSQVLMMWYEAEHHRAEQPKHGHNQISLMLGMLIAMPTVIAIALLDGLIPGEFSLAVLYVVPLVACVWVRNERLLWTMFALLQVLAIGGLYWGPSPYSDDAFQRALQNRILNAVMMLIVTGILGFSIRSTGKRPTST